MKYPYIAAWGFDMGSLPYYIKGESATAEADKAPEDVIYKRDFSSITEVEKEEALAAAENGTAFLVRNGQGEPVRVWYRFGAVALATTKARIEDRVTTILNQGDTC